MRKDIIVMDLACWHLYTNSDSVDFQSKSHHGIDSKDFTKLRLYNRK